MSGLSQRLMRLERSVGTMVPDQTHCIACHGLPLLAFSDEPENVGSRMPYDGPGDTCRFCRMPPPSIHVLKLPTPIAEQLRTLPWSNDPRHRHLEKLSLLRALLKGESEEAGRLVQRLHEKDASGRRQWLFS